MPIPHPRRRRLGGGGLLDQGHVRDWAPPGWYWEVLPSRGRKEDEHARRYMIALEGRFDNTWQVLQGSHWSYDPVMVPSLWVSIARDDTRRALRF